MRLLIGTFILSATGTFASAQGVPQPPQAPKAANEAATAMIIAELAAKGGQGSVKNSPLSCEEVNESVQTLADGNRIVRKSTGKMYRNTEGRVRREMPGGMGGMLGTTYSTGQGISIASGFGGQGGLFNTNLTTSRVIEVPSPSVTVTTKGELTIAQQKAIEARAMEMNAKAKEMGATAPLAVTGQLTPLYSTGVMAPVPAQGLMGAYTMGSQSSKYDIRTEELGTRDFEGVSAEGTRRTTTIPAYAIGNERPIEIVYERWFSKELGLVVYSKNTDPRFGEQTYRLTSIVRAEPDPSLFAVPLKRGTTEPSTVYRVAGTPTVINTTKTPKPQN